MGQCADPNPDFVAFANIIFYFNPFQSVICSSISNALFESAEDIARRQTLKCNNLCPYGFKTDIEGRYTCNCLDPCAVSSYVNLDCILTIYPLYIGLHCSYPSIHNTKVYIVTLPMHPPYLVPYRRKMQW